MRFPQISAAVLDGKLGKTALQSYDLHFLHERHFKQAQQPGLHGKPHHQPHWEAETIPQPTAIYPLKPLWKQDFPQAPRSTGLSEKLRLQSAYTCPDSAPLELPDFHACLNSR